MLKSLRFLGCATGALVVAATSTAHSQAPRAVTVDYGNAPLSRVASGFAVFSGRSITVATNVGDPTLTGSAHGVAWDAALDQMLATQSLIARPDSAGGLRIDRERRVSFEFENAPLSHVLRAIAGYSGYRIEPLAGVSEPNVTTSVRDTDWQRALDKVLAQVDLLARPDSGGVFHIEPRVPR